MISHIRTVKRKSKVTKRQKNLLTTDIRPALCMPVTTSSVAYRAAWELKLCSMNRNQNSKDNFCNFKVVRVNVNRDSNPAILTTSTAEKNNSYYTLSLI